MQRSKHSFLIEKTIAVFFVIGLISPSAHAATVTPENLLVSTANTIYEHNPQGSLVQSFTTQYPGGYPGTEYARDITVDNKGKVYVYNGTFSPYMSIFDSNVSSWNHMTYAGFSTVNNGSYGGIDIYGTTVFASDMFTYGGGETQGIITFDTLTGAATRFASDIEPIDLTIGLDGLLYALSPGGSPEGRTIDVYDPSTLAHIRSINLTSIFGWTGHRSIAIDKGGDIFIADWDGKVHHITNSGALIATITPSCDWIGFDIHCEFNDIDISKKGRIALSTRFGEIFLTDTSFSTMTTFNAGRDSGFVDFIPSKDETISVDIDIKPGIYPNRINLRSKGLIPVAILTNADFDANAIGRSTVRFGPAGAHAVPEKNALKDVDGDGDGDVVLYFRIQETGIAFGNTEARLTGETIDEQAIEGFDSIQIIKPKPLLHNPQRRLKNSPAGLEVRGRAGRRLR